MRRMTVWAIAAALCSVGALSAQEKPDFSGKWTMTTPDGPPDVLCGQQCTITQDATSLTVTRTVGPTATNTFISDGSEHKIGGTPQGQGGTVYTAMWDGNKLRISIATGVSALGGLEVVFSMNAGQMEVENSLKGGISARPALSKNTYKKN